MAALRPHQTVGGPVAMEPLTARQANRMSAACVCHICGAYLQCPELPDPEPNCSPTPSSERPEKRSLEPTCHAGSIFCLPGLSVVIPANESEPVVCTTIPERLGLLGDAGPAPPPEPSSSQE